MSSEPLSVRPVVVTRGYPTAAEPNVGPFVQALVRQWTRGGAEVAVIAPRSLYSLHKRRVELTAQEARAEGEPTVLHPGFASFSNRVIGPIRTAELSFASFRGAVRRAARRLPFRPDLAYGHFLLPAGGAALDLAERWGVPAVAAVGESAFDLYDKTFTPGRAARTARSLQGIVAVSRENRDWLVDAYGVDPGRILLAPNATDTEKFRPRERKALRRELGLPEDRFLIAFSGHFEERKGPLRVMEAIRPLPEVGAIFLGAGSQQPVGDQVLMARSVPNVDVARWIAAADVYVLPTLAEGSPNAVIEAVACGLPVVSSDIPSVREVTSEDSALLVDPRDPAAIGDAIRRLAEDPALRQRMGNAARALAEGSSLARRAQRIARFLEEVVARGR